MKPARQLFLLFPVVLCLTLPAIAGGGSWSREEGGYYVQVSLTSLTAEEAYWFDGTRRLLFTDTANFRNGQYGITDLSFYGEYGITDWLTGVASTQYKVAVREAEVRATRRDTTASASGLGDLWLGARVRLFPKDYSPYVATVTLGWKLPTGSPHQQIPLGTGVPDYEAALSVGSTFSVIEDIRGHAQLSGGYRLRTGASNEYNYMAEVGINLSSSILLQWTLDGVHSSADFEYAATEGANESAIYSFAVNQSYMRWNFGVIFDIDESMDLNLGYGRYSSGRNALAGSGISVGVSWKK